MRVDGAFEVPVDVEEAWATLLDVERVAPCLPGARLESSDAEGRYTGSMRVKLGPVTSTFKGTVHIADADASARRVVLQAAARDTRGQGAATATITSTLTPAGDGTRVAVETDLKLAGTAAQFGRGVVHDVTRRLLDEFGERLAAEIQRPAARAMPTT